MGKLVRGDLPPSWQRFRFASRTKAADQDWRVLVLGFAPDTRPDQGGCVKRHERYSFHMVLAGQSMYQMPDGSQYELQPGSYFCLHPLARQVYPAMSPGFLEAVVIIDWPSAKETIGLGLLDLEPICGRVAPFIDLAEDFAELVTSMEQGKLSPFPLLEVLTWIRRVQSQSLKPAIDGDAAAIAEARRLLASDLEKRLSGRQVARAVGWSYETFRKRFRKATGMAPGAYRISKRIEAAWGLLASGLAVAEVAQSLGYCDAFVFSTQFKEYTGRMPSAIQRRGT